MVKHLDKQGLARFAEALGTPLLSGCVDRFRVPLTYVVREGDALLLFTVSSGIQCRSLARNLKRAMRDDIVLSRSPWWLNRLGATGYRLGSHKTRVAPTDGAWIERRVPLGAVENVLTRYDRFGCKA